MRGSGIVAVVMALVLVVGACSDDDDSDEAESVELPDGAAAVIDDYYEAVAVQHDSDAMLGLVTEDFQFIAVEGALDSEGWADQIDLLFENFGVERLGDPAVVGGGSEYVVSQAERTTGSGVDDVAFSVMRVVEVDGTWLIGTHSYTETAAPS